MTTDPRTLARELLSRSSGASTPAGSGPAVSPGPAAGVGAVPARRSRGRARLEDLPQVRESLERDRLLTEGLAPHGLPNPYYMAHDGVNGATIHLRGQEYINYSSYNYLSLTGHPRMMAAAKAAIDEYGTASGATRTVSGNIPLHEELEATIAGCYGVEDATTVASGYLTNASVVAFVLGEKDMALCDALVHNSVVSGTLWAHCQRRYFKHNDPDSLEAILKRSRDHFENVLVITEGVYSMDGDIGQLPELIEVARRYDCLFMVDEAHSFAVLGETGLGIKQHHGLAPDDVDIWMGTLSKGLAAHGGFVAGSHEFIQACRMSAPGMSLYANGLTPATAASALTAIRIVQDEPDRLVRLRRNSELFLRLAKEAGLDTGPSFGTPIVPIILGSTYDTVAASAQMTLAGINVNPILYPAVAEGEGRLRFFLCADHTEEQIRYTIETLSGIVAAARG